MKVSETDIAWLERKWSMIQEASGNLHVSKPAYGRVTLYKSWFAWTEISVYRNKIVTARDYLETAKQIAKKLKIEKIIIKGQRQ